MSIRPIGRILVILLCLALPARAQDTNAANPEPPATFIPAPPRLGPSLRYIIVIENTANMKRLRESAADAVSRLLLGGFNDRAQPGELVALWLLGANLSTNAFPVVVWDPDQRATTSGQSFRLLKELKSSDKSANLTELMMTLMTETATGAQTTVYFVGSGSDPIIGTPYDQGINSLFAQHGEGMRKARKPFVTVLLSEGGNWVAHAVTPGDRVPFVPPFPKRRPPALNPRTTAAPPEPESRQPPPLILVGTNRMLSVEEIQEKLREAQRAAPTNTPPAH